ncbi:uncharacterized protein K489DRAFT_125298 [Dissoconium aciculare CBS 342.82]|uniref:Uncharacterized protein n=1 Tax=Dissoconium aciculare CBS 342.82 TaxID=1314786 RepID=A0A6J3MIN8_9PEZI|nr:uncharacterized protein K489DRAFT_125298 [Dissoconium aciculare CBS 342.82]KAF1826777.1 hypothetical protein K489DRAFT_125298 [Dissoconium aciculare CBS 342.82]
MRNATSYKIMSELDRRFMNLIGAFCTLPEHDDLPEEFPVSFHKKQLRLQFVMKSRSRPLSKNMPVDDSRRAELWRSLACCFVWIAICSHRLISSPVCARDMMFLRPASKGSSSLLPATSDTRNGNT